MDGQTDTTDRIAVPANASVTSGHSNGGEQAASQRVALYESLRAYSPPAMSQ